MVGEDSIRTCIRWRQSMPTGVVVPSAKANKAPEGGQQVRKKSWNHSSASAVSSQFVKKKLGIV